MQDQDGLLQSVRHTLLLLGIYRAVQGEELAPFHGQNDMLRNFGLVDLAKLLVS